MNLRRISLDDIFRIVISIVGVYLFVVGGKIAVEDKTSSAMACFSFGFLLITLSIVSKFKHFEGFGFKAELWEEKQLEAARLVDTLRDTAFTVGKQLVYVADHVGKPFTMPKAVDMVLLENDIAKMLKNIGIDEKLINDTLHPISINIESISRMEAIKILVDILNKGNTEKAKKFKEEKHHIDEKGAVILTADFIKMLDWADWITDEERKDIKHELNILIDTMRRYEWRNDN